MAKRRRVQSTLNNQNISLPLLLLLCITVCCILIFQQQQLPQQTHQQHDQQKYDQIVDEKYLQPQQQYLMDLEQSAQSSSYLENIADLKKQEAVETSYEEATSRIKPVYAFINRDGGCQADMDWLAEKFQFDYVLYSLEKGVFKFIQGLNIPSQIQFLSQENTLMPEVQEIAQFFCDTFPIIFIADANPDGRFLLAKLDRDANNILTEITSTCKTEKIIFISANRFDYTFGQSNADLSEYYKLIKRVMLRQDISTVGEDEQEVDDEDGVALPNRKETKVIWVATSPWELKYAEIKLQDDYMKYELIRRVGYIHDPPDYPLPPYDEPKAVVSRVGMHSGWYEFLIKNKSELKDYIEVVNDHQPNVLTQYKALIILPYQSGDTTIYSNLAEGTRMLVPSPRLFNEILINFRTGSEVPPGVDFWGLYIIDFNYDDLGSEWYKLMDYYSDELAEFFYTFDSYDELLELIKLDVETLDSKNIRVKGPEKFKQMQKQALIQWSRIFIK